MVSIVLPDGTIRSYDGPVSGNDIARDIGPGWTKAALALCVDGTVKDLATVVTRDAAVRLVTAKDSDALALLRHDAAHVMAEAVQELYPETQVTFGPATERGFYYDFARKTPFTPDDLERIEARMRDIVDRDEPIRREVWRREEAIAYFTGRGEKYKAEWVTQLPEGEDISIYRQGQWLDLCRGPHLPSTGRLGKAFRLMKLAGAYWRGDARNEMLQRIYGTCWPDEAQLKAYLNWMEEAERRDHRRLGREMELFHLQEEAVGSVFWHPKGWTLYRTIETYVRRRLAAAGYVEVKTPQLVDRSLWEDSGHWEKFRENMFTVTVGDGKEKEEILAIKPMNCPCHVQIFRQGIKSYRELPLRMAEFGACHRYEPSGALHGLMRVRAFTQDDAHIFCTEEQILSETQDFCILLRIMYHDFGFTDVRVKFSDRPVKRAGSDETWDKAEKALLEASRAAGLEITLNPGEGAFYGPKLEFVLKDALGRDWQCGTLQADFVLPERLNAAYVGVDGAKHRPVMLHRAILGSFERFIGILLEHYAGRMPLWLAPVQIVVATIVSEADSYAEDVTRALCTADLRAVVDTRNEKITLKVREHSLAKVPLLLVVGRREAETRTVALRRLGVKTQEILALDAAVDTLGREAAMPAPG
ncbi:MAG: threonyl-tRNA synthetase [Rhodospirillaceae bacterium]|nr:MAG: threonyl-tRNA synthetase [Rhodospirillaceae bacterium]